MSSPTKDPSQLPKEYPNLQNTDPPTPYSVQQTVRRIWDALYSLRDKASKLQDCCDTNSLTLKNLGVKSLPGQRSTGSPGVPITTTGGGTGTGPPPAGALVITSCGQQIVLSNSGDFCKENPVSCQFLKALYNCIQQTPGGWDLGCAQSSGAFIWPACGTLPIVNGQPTIPPGLIIGGAGGFQLKPCVLLSPDGFHWVWSDESSCGCQTPCASGGHVTIPDKQYIITSCGHQILLSDGAFTGPSAQFLYEQYLGISSVPGGWDLGCGNNAGAFIWPSFGNLPIGPDGKFFIPSGFLIGNQLAPWVIISGAHYVVKDTDACGQAGPCQ